MTKLGSGLDWEDVRILNHCRGYYQCVNCGHTANLTKEEEDGKETKPPRCCGVRMELVDSLAEANQSREILRMTKKK